MLARDLRKKYIEFFTNKGHKLIKSAPLIPENDPTVLFTTAGMHPLVPFLIGKKHPLGKRLVGVQKCVRTGDIDEVGDISHLTFFEMLGNWSLGDYFKNISIKYSYDFLTSPEWLNIPKEKTYIMPAGDCRETLIEMYPKVFELCVERGYRMAGRDHIIAFNTKREV